MSWHTKWPHQWFGDSSQPHGGHLWLNEGFASWMGTKCSDHFNPDLAKCGWGRALQKSAVMRQDSLRYNPSHSAAHHQRKPGQPMLLSNHLYQRPSFLRCWKIISRRKVSRRNAALHVAPPLIRARPLRIFGRRWKRPRVNQYAPLSTGWTEQPGLPVINVSSTCEGEKNVVRLEQGTFQRARSRRKNP